MSFHADKKIVALVPAYNEALHIGPVLKVLKNSSIFNKILIIDDGSSDDTGEIVRKEGFDVLTLNENRGKGAAIQAGLTKIGDADIYFFADSDLVGLTKEHITSLINPLLENPSVAMTVGKFVGGRKRTDWAQKFVPNISGQRAMSKNLVKSLPDLSKSGFGVEIKITGFAKKNGFKSQEVLLPKLTQVMKEEKLGFLKGILYRLKMYRQLLRSLIRRR